MEVSNSHNPKESAKTKPVKGNQRMFSYLKFLKPRTSAESCSWAGSERCNYCNINFIKWCNNIANSKTSFKKIYDSYYNMDGFVQNRGKVIVRKNRKLFIE